MNEWIICPCCKHYSAYTKLIDRNNVLYGLVRECECANCGHKFTEPYTPSLVLKRAIEASAQKYRKIIEDELTKKEATPMKVSYNGFTGELVELKQYSRPGGVWTYGLHIYDSEKRVTHSFTGVKLEDMKFLAGR